MSHRLSALKAEIASDPQASSRRKQAAQQRAAREVKNRAEKARAALDRLRSEREKRRKRHPSEKRMEAKASLSDPDAQLMRFADNSIRAGFNAQIAAVPKQGVIVSIEMTNRRNDAGLAVPRVTDIVRRYGRAPEKLLLDTHYATANDIAALGGSEAPVHVYAPPPVQKATVGPSGLASRKSRRNREPEAVKAWRVRMQSSAGQDIYRRRKLIERTNANLKNHGFGFVPVRGIIKAKAVALLHAIANNLMAARRLRLQIA